MIKEKVKVGKDLWQELRSSYQKTLILEIFELDQTLTMQKSFKVYNLTPCLHNFISCNYYDHHLRCKLQKKICLMSMGMKTEKQKAPKKALKVYSLVCVMREKLLKQMIGKDKTPKHKPQNKHNSNVLQHNKPHRTGLDATPNTYCLIANASTCVLTPI